MTLESNSKQWRPFKFLLIKYEENIDHVCVSSHAYLQLNLFRIQQEASNLNICSKRNCTYSKLFEEAEFIGF